MIELLLATSSLAGLAVGLVGPVWAIAVASVAIATLSTVITWSQGFQALSGIAVVTGCLIACQISYMAGRFVIRQYGFPDLSASDEIDGEPDDARQRSISDQDDNDGKPPPRSPLS